MSKRREFVSLIAKTETDTSILFLHKTSSSLSFYRIRYFYNILVLNSGTFQAGTFTINSDLMT